MVIHRTSKTSYKIRKSTGLGGQNPQVVILILSLNNFVILTESKFFKLFLSVKLKIRENWTREFVGLLPAPISTSFSFLN